MNSYVHATARTLASLATFYLLSFVGVQISKRWLGGWPATDVGILLAEGIAAAIAFRFRARIAAYVVLGLSAYTVSTLVVHAIYGVRAAQGAPTHCAVIGAGLIGVTLGAIVATTIPRMPHATRS